MARKLKPPEKWECACSIVLTLLRDQIRKENVQIREEMRPISALEFDFVRGRPRGRRGSFINYDKNNAQTIASSDKS